MGLGLEFKIKNKYEDEREKQTKFVARTFSMSRFASLQIIPTSCVADSGNDRWVLHDKSASD